METSTWLLLFLNDRDIEGPYQEPIRTFTSLTEEDTNDSNTHFWLGYFHESIDFDEERAKNELYKVLTLDEGHPYANLVLAGFSDDISLEERKKFLEKVLERQPLNYRALSQLMEIYVSLGDKTKARNVINIILNNSAYQEQNYGIMNSYINDVLTSAAHQQSLREKVMLELR